MAGPAIRAVELCTRLSARHQVALACPGAAALSEVPFALHDQVDGRGLRAILSRLGADDVFITQGFGFPLRDALSLPPGVRLVLDLYDPVQLELLARYGGTPTAGERLHLLVVRRRLLQLIGAADHVLCASERQRAFWLGWLSAAGRLTPDQLAADPRAKALLAIVPFGLSPAERVQADAADPLGVAHGPGELPVLWWGGLWDWMDPVAAVRAIDLLRRRGVPAALVLPAANRPGAAPMAAAAAAQAEARARQLWGPGRGVFQLPAWIPYQQRRAALDAAAVAISCHRPSLEAELAFRTRLLDCVWAGLPAVATAGDELSARGEAEGWVVAPPAGDVDAIAAALQQLLDPERRRAAREAAGRARAGYSWDLSAGALLALLDRPAPRRPHADGWGRAASFAPGELAAASPLQLARAAAGKLVAKARKVRS